MTGRAELTRAPARKALGQHFLFDPDILKRAALAAGPVSERTVIEVGPGPGGLTRALLDQGAARVIAFEADARFASALLNWPEARAGRLVVVQGDARKADWPALLALNGAAQAMIVANLPYNVGTPLLVDWLKAGPWRREMALMFQKEVAERIVASHGTDAYGRLAVLARSVCRTRMAFTLPPGAFKPPPKVASAVVDLQPLDQPFDDLEALETVAASAFGQRRKTLRRSLAAAAAQAGATADALLEAAGIDPGLRAEVVDVAGFQRLARAWRAAHSS